MKYDHFDIVLSKIDLKSQMVKGEENTIRQFEALFNYATIGIVVTDEEARIIKKSSAIYLIKH